MESQINKEDLKIDLIDNISLSSEIEHNLKSF